MAWNFFVERKLKLIRLIKAIIIEDEPISAIRLERLIKKVAPDLEIIKKLTSVKDSVTWLSHHQTDLIFLDIHLSDGDAFSIFDQIELQTPIIFITAYDQFALQAFKHNSIDYLLKPVDKTQLELSLNKFRNFFLQKTSPIAVDYKALKVALQSSYPTYKKRFLIHVGNKLKIVNVEQIAYCYSQNKTTFLVTHKNRTYPIDYSLNQLEKELHPEQFYRVNRKFLIHSDAIQEMHYISKSKIKIELSPLPPMEVYVSIEKIGQFKRWLDV